MAVHACNVPEVVTVSANTVCNETVRPVTYLFDARSLTKRLLKSLSPSVHTYGVTREWMNRFERNPVLENFTNSCCATLILIKLYLSVQLWFNIGLLLHRQHTQLFKSNIRVYIFIIYLLPNLLTFYRF
jgi:hypothetical protein